MGAEIDGWQVVRRLSMSAIAEVFLVRPREQGPLRVLKRLLPMYAEDAELVEIFQREAALGPFLEHPNLPRVLSFGDHDGAPYIVLEHIRGAPLGRLVQKLGKGMPPEVALAILRDVVRALSHLYALKSEQGRSLVIAHRDVTPGNVLVTVDGRAVLIDFGIVAGAVSRRETASNVVKATWRYAAPEQLDGGPVSSAFDVYTLGALLHLMLSGSRPFSGCNDPEEILHAKKTEVLSCTDFSQELQGLIRDCTSVNPEQRPSMPEDLAAKIESLGPASNLAVVELALGPISEVERDDRRHAAEKRIPLSAEQRGEDITDPDRTEDITDVGEFYLQSDTPVSTTTGAWSLILLLLIVALLIARNI